MCKLLFLFIYLFICLFIYLLIIFINYFGIVAISLSLGSPMHYLTKVSFNTFLSSL
jgi:amino acid permease